MIKKLTHKSILALLALAMTFLLIGSLTFVRPFAATNDGDVSPFYENPYSWDNPVNTIVKGADGSYAITQAASGGGTRLFYGDYVRGSNETPYYVNLTDFTMELSVDRMSAGGNLMIGFLTYVQNGDYPINGYGQGLVLKLNDDGGGNTGFVPSVETVAKSDANHTQYTTSGNSYLVYNNASTGRTSHLGKKMILHIYVEGNNLNVYVDWARDEVNPSTAFDYRAQIPLASLPTSGVQAFDYTKAHLTFTNDGNTDGVGFTVYSITDANSNAYWNSVGGKLNNSVKATAEYSAAVSGFSITETTGAMAKDYYIAKANFAGVNTSALRAEDLVEYNAAAALSTEGFDTAALAVADQVFEGYTADGEITDLDDALKVYYYYLNLADSLTEYEAIVSNIRAALSTQDYGQVAVVSEIDSILSDYAEYDDSKYIESKARYDAVKTSYNVLSAFAKDLAKDKLAELEDWFKTAYNSYYVTTGTYFSTYFKEVVDGEHLGELRNNPARANRNSDGTTSITLPDSSSFIISYGNDDLEDYKVSLSNFSMTFSLDSVPTNARFAINFATERSAIACGQNKTPGLTLMFRSDWGTNQLSVSLSKTIASLGEYPTTEEVAGIQGFGIIGLIGSAEGRYTEDVTIKFEAEGENYTLTVSMGTSSASATLTKAFMDSIFVDVDNNNQTVDYSSLAMNFTVGEGLTPFGGGQDIVLTIKNINDDYFRSVEQTKSEINAFVSTIATLKAKDALTIEEIRSFNNNKAKIVADVDALRTYEKANCDTLLAAITESDMNAINAKAAAFVSTKLDAVTVTVDNFAQVETTLSEIEGYWGALSDEQKALYADYATKLAACQADVVGCRAAKDVIDDITVLVAKVLLPSTEEAITAERNAVKSAYDALDAKYAAMVTNYDEFTTYSNALDAYDPVVAVENAIDRLDVDYATISSGNLNAAKTAVADVKAAYDELLEDQKSDVNNYAKIAEFEQKIATFEQYVIDYATAAIVIQAIADADALYATLTSENREACAAAIIALTEDYNELSDAQKAMVENYSKIAEIQARVDEYDADVQATATAQAVIDKIADIGTVAYTDDSKAKIDAARTAYDALNDAAKAKVNNLTTLTDAESTYATLKAADDAKKAEKGGCGSSVTGFTTLGAVLVVLGAVVMLSKKRYEI